MPRFARPLDLFRRALASPRGRAALLALALALFGAQTFLQAHAVAHELGPNAEDVCEHCLASKVGAAAPAPTAVAAVATTDERVDLRLDQPPRSRAPLVVRSRAPPSCA